MAQWTFRYTTLENPSNYITVTGNVIDGKIKEFPYELAQSFFNGNPELMNISFIFPNTVNYIRQIFYIANNGANGSFNPSTYFNKVRNIEDFYDLSDCNTLFYSGFEDFRYLKSIKNLYNTSNVTNMANMFSDCHNLISVSNLSTSNVKDMNDMFYHCYSLTNIPNFDTSKVTDMDSMFCCCYNLTTIPNLDTSKVIGMFQIFWGCNNLITIPNLNTSKVTDMRSMFYLCNNLINIPSFDTSNVIMMRDMFHRCYNLSNLSLKNIAKSLPNVSQLTSQNSNLQNIGLSQNQINYISTTRYASQLQARGWNIEDNYVKPDLVKSLKMKQSDGTMNLAMLGTDAEYVDMEDGTTLEDTIQNLKQYIDDNVANILGGMY